MVIINPWLSQESLRWYLLKLKEDKELDAWIDHYIRFSGCRTIRRPSKGPAGEQGKDLTAVENEISMEYCSYVIKAGTLHDNLSGNYGVIKQMRDAMMIPLEEPHFKYSKRTVRVVYNGEEGYRGAIIQFEQEARQLENEIGTLLLRPVERWDIDAITQKFYCKKDEFMSSEISRRHFDKMRMLENECEEFVKNVSDCKNGIGDPFIMRSFITGHVERINQIISY